MRYSVFLRSLRERSRNVTVASSLVWDITKSPHKNREARKQNKKPTIITYNKTMWQAIFTNTKIKTGWRQTTNTLEVQSLAVAQEKAEGRHRHLMSQAQETHRDHCHTQVAAGEQESCPVPKWNRQGSMVRAAGQQVSQNWVGSSFQGRHHTEGNVRCGIGHTGSKRDKEKKGSWYKRRMGTKDRISQKKGSTTQKQ